MGEGETPIGVLIAVVALACIMIFVFPLFISTFVDVEEEEATGIFAVIEDVWGIVDSVITFMITPLPAGAEETLGDLLDSIEDYIETLTSSWSLVPTPIAIIILVPSMIGLFYSIMIIVKDLIPFT